MTNRVAVRWMASYFFFQAEDGIRVVAVTGVQTCALPICPRPLAWQSSVATVRLDTELCQAKGLGPKIKTDQARCDSHIRSEERRVGKEGRSRWSPYH